MRRRLIWAFMWLTLAGAASAQESEEFLDEIEDSIAAVISSIERVAPDKPMPVGVGIKIMQIVDVDQRAENFTVVARARAVWQDPALAFDIDKFPLGIRSMSFVDFERFTRENGIIAPLANFENVQGRTFTKASTVGWDEKGNAFYSGEYVLKLQAPDFNFRQYPFDTQLFFVRLLARSPVDFIQFVPLEGFSGLDPVLGEEEWVIRETWTEVDEAEAISGWQSSRFSFGMKADRHMTYYWMRIFMPLLLLSLVSWANLFLEEYRRRIDIAGANLLAFIAFSFTISGDLPRLGYVTFIDILLMSMFILSALSVAYNVMLRRLSVHEMDEKARQIDWHVTYWGYPLFNTLIVVLLVAIFFW